MRLPVLLKPQLAAKQKHTLTTEEKGRRWIAATRLVQSLQGLAQRGQQVVQEMIGAASFVEWEHYPENDVRDKKRASQYFYHAHPGLQRPFTEHGHFHLFVHAQELGLRSKSRRYEEAPAHVFAVSMNAQGLPTGFFVVNRWVTKGPWLSYAECEIAIDNFAVKGRQGNKDINCFLTSLVSLYRTQILALIQQRDVVVEKLCAQAGSVGDRRSLFANRQIEVLCYTPISLLADIEALEKLM
jgi:hypothetical protein